MDNIVEYYTNKEPIIKTQPTQWLRQPISYLDDDSVYKMGRSDCGRDVIIVPYLNEKEKQEALMVINDWISEGEIVVAQEFLPPTYLTNPKSRNEKFLVEIRPYGFAYGENHFHISELFAGKATSSLGDKKNNVTRGAFELVVLSV